MVTTKTAAAAQARAAEEKRNLLLASVGLGLLLAVGIATVKRVMSTPRAVPVAPPAPEPPPAPAAEVEEVIPAPQFPAFPAAEPAAAAPATVVEMKDRPLKVSEDGTWSGGPVIVRPTGAPAPR